MTRSAAAVTTRPGFADRRSRIDSPIAKKSDQPPKRQRWSGAGTPVNALPPLAVLDALEQTQAIIGVAGGCIVHWSPGAERLYGWTASEAIGRCAGDLLEQKSTGSSEASGAESDHPASWKGEFRRAHKDGRELAIEARCMLRRDLGGRPMVIELDRMIEPTERTADPQPTRDPLAEANDRPLGRMAHDFNNLLGIITLNLELARERAGDTELREMIGEALDAAWQGSELTRRLAGIARREPP